MIRRIRELTLPTALSVLVAPRWGLHQRHDGSPGAHGVRWGNEHAHPDPHGRFFRGRGHPPRDGPGGAAYLVDRSDNTLYVFANDIPGSGASACQGACVDQWPPFDDVDLT